MLHSILIQATSISQEQTQLIVEKAVFFGLMLIVASAINFVYGNARVPFLGNALPVFIGGLTVSAITTRITFIIVEAAGVSLLPYLSDQNWVYNNEQNIHLVNGFLESNPLLCISLIMFTLLLSMVLGAVGGWLISKPALKLSSTYLMVANLILVGLICVFGRNIVALSGGTMGVFVPDVFAFYGGERTIIAVILTFLVVLGVFIIIKAAKNSPTARMLKAVQDNELTAAVLGKDIVRARGEVILLGSGLMALAGALFAFYTSFMIEAPFHNSYWTYWPLLMILVGGLGSQVGTFLGVGLVYGLRTLIIVFRTNIQELFFFPFSYVEDLLFASLILIFLILRLGGIIREKPMCKPLVGYELKGNRGLHGSGSASHRVIGENEPDE